MVLSKIGYFRMFCYLNSKLGMSNLMSRLDFFTSAALCKSKQNNATFGSAHAVAQSKKNIYIANNGFKNFTLQVK